MADKVKKSVLVACMEEQIFKRQAPLSPFYKKSIHSARAQRFAQPRTQRPESAISKKDRKGIAHSTIRKPTYVNPYA